MAGKKKAQKKRLAKTRKQAIQADNELTNKAKKVPASQPGDETENVNNGAEPNPPEINEDEEIQQLEDELADKALEVETAPKPFDPNSVIANILRKKNGG